MNMTFFKSLKFLIAIYLCIGFGASLFAQEFPMPPMIYRKNARSTAVGPKSKLEKNCFPHAWSIVLSDSSKILGHGILDRRGASFYLDVDNPILKSLRPSETISLQRIDQDDRAMFKGFPADTCWLFNITGGPIQLLSPLPEELHQFSTGIQTTSGERQKLTRSNVDAIISNPSLRVREAMDSGKLWKAVMLYNEEQKRLLNQSSH
jgi:hypothetical protein